MLTHPENYSYNEIKDTITMAPTLQLRAMLSIAYGCGVRVSELNQIKGSNIKRTKDRRDRQILRIYTPTLKNRNDHSRFIPIYRLDEGWLIGMILEYKENRPGVLFPYHRSTIWRWLKKYNDINPHGYRKIRLTHLVTEFGFSDQQLVKFAGWSDSRPAKDYVKLNLEDIVPVRRK